MAVALALCCAAGTADVAASDAGPAPWDLRDLYASDEAWTASYEHTASGVQALGRYAGTLAASAESMLTALTAISDLRREAARLSAYASLRADEDVRVASNLERRQRAESLETALAKHSAWLAPEIQALGETRVRGFVAQSPVLARRFDFFLLDTLRRAPHTLGVEAEAVLAASNDVLLQPVGVYQQLAVGDLPYPTIEWRGAQLQLTQPAYEKHRSAADRAERKAVFDAFWGAFAAYQGSFGAMLTAQVIGDVFAARARRFDSALQRALFDDRMPERVYRTLVAQAHAGLPTFHRYLRLRRQLLGIESELAYHDLYAPLLQLAEPPSYPLAQSQAITLAALAPLGTEYTALMERGFAARWTDAFPRPGKATGGYVNDAYDVHPYVLLNHNDDYMSLSTVAHEWGHAVHSLLANASQPYEKAAYGHFIGESAAIANELLLSDHLVRTAGSREQALYFLGEQLELIRTNFFRQVMFAEFQLLIHELREQGQPLSGATLTERYCSLLKLYHGEPQGVMTIDPLYCNEWAYITHFYFGFYVWQYATSIAGAAQFAQAIEEGSEAARERFVGMLKAGGSDYPYETSRRAGVDLGEATPYQALFRRMERVMDQIEAIVRDRR
jgi:oligoendopeptidase F